MSTVYGEIEARRGSILKTWRASLDKSSGQGRPSSARRVNRFTDSVTYLVNESTNDVITWLAGPGGLADIPESFVDLCRLKAIQETSPSIAFGFIFDLKRVIRSTLGGPKGGSCVFDQVDRRIDLLVLFAFDRYVEFREKVYLIRIAEMQRGEGLMKRRQAGKLGACGREAV